jgi:hypothetical protein
MLELMACFSFRIAALGVLGLAALGVSVLLVWTVLAVVRRRIQFTVRTMLFGVAAFAIVFGTLVKFGPALQQRRFVNEIRSIGGFVDYDIQSEEMGGDFFVTRSGRLLPSWLREVFGDDLFARVNHITLVSSGLTESDFDQLAALGKVPELTLSNTNTTDGLLMRLRQFPELEALWLEGCPITDDGLSHLVELPNLDFLVVRQTRITDAGLAKLEGKTQFRLLGLSGTQVTDNGLVHLRHFPNLQWVDLAGTQVSDQGLAHLKVLSSLRNLDLRDTQVSEEGLQELQRALPRCNILK